MSTVCAIDDCDSPVFVKSRGWCKKHYHRWYRTGDPTKASFDRSGGTPIERWWSKVDREGVGGCWLWIGGLDRHGYGQFDVITDGLHKNHRAHRWGYQQLVRELDDTETLDHLCRVHACVNPAHLDPVTHRENVLRGESPFAVHARKTQCPRGHPYDTVDNRGGRACSECNRQRCRERYRRVTTRSPTPRPDP